MRYRYCAGIGASIILGLTSVAAAIGKLLSENQLLVFYHLESFLSPTLASLVSHAIPWIELILGLLLITGVMAKLMAIFFSVLILGFIFTNSWLIAHGLAYEPCGCFGIFEKILQGKLSTIDSLVIDIGLLALVLIILFCYPGRFFDIRPWFLRKND